MIERNSKVVYNGENRSYLKKAVGKVLNLNVTGTSAYVHFMNDEGQEFTEWVGVGSLLEHKDDAVSTAIKVLQGKLNEIRSKMTVLRRDIDELENEEENVERAISALQELE